LWNIQFTVVHIERVEEEGIAARELASFEMEEMLQDLRSKDRVVAIHNKFYQYIYYSVNYYSIDI
jgi:hypothetical protein